MPFCQECGQPTKERAIEGRTRPVCTSCGAVTYLDPKLAVATVIARDGRILFGLRGPGTREAGKWGLPTGFVERGERVEDAAIRETLEEVGLRVTLGPLIGLYSATGETVALAVFGTVAATGEPRPADDLVDIGWFPADALPPLAFPRDRLILADWRRMMA